jgi:hypothetical protein
MTTFQHLSIIYAYRTIPFVRLMLGISPQCLQYVTAPYPRCVALPVVWPTFQAGTLRYMTTTYSLVKYHRTYMSKSSSTMRHHTVKQIVTA